MYIKSIKTRFYIIIINSSSGSSSIVVFVVVVGEEEEEEEEEEYKDFNIYSNLVLAVHVAPGATVTGSAHDAFSTQTNSL